MAVSGGPDPVAASLIYLHIALYFPAGPLYYSRDIPPSVGIHTSSLAPIAELRLTYCASGSISCLQLGSVSSLLFGLQPSCPMPCARSRCSKRRCLCYSPIVQRHELGQSRQVAGHSGPGVRGPGLLPLEPKGRYRQRSARSGADELHGLPGPNQRRAEFARAQELAGASAGRFFFLCSSGMYLFL